MKVSNFVLALVLLLLVIFGVLNRHALTFPHTIDLGFSKYQGPIGLILLVAVAGCSVLFVLLNALNDLRQKSEANRLFKQLEQLRATLDSQEESRFKRLNDRFSERFDALESKLGTGRGGSNSPTSPADFSGVYARIDRVRDELAADIGQMEDALMRQLGANPKPDRSSENTNTPQTGGLLSLILRKK
jgi:uncharacterized integral membrane protein